MLGGRRQEYNRCVSDTEIIKRANHPRVESGREYPIYWSLYPLIEVLKSLQEISPIAAIAFEKYIDEFDNFDLHDRESYHRTRKTLITLCATYREQYPFFCRRVAEALEDFKGGRDRVVKGVLEKIPKI